jgi:hypothetical protein
MGTKGGATGAPRALFHRADDGHILALLEDIGGDMPSTVWMKPLVRLFPSPFQTGAQLAEQTQRDQEASRQLTQESVQAYMDFVNSMFSFAQQGPQAAERGAERAR